jgi:hypothetical protein
MVANVSDVEEGGEGLESGGIRQFRNKAFRIDVELFLLYSGTKVEI